MYQKILNFIKYNNAFTIIIGLLFFGSGVAFATSPDVRESVYTSSETVVSIDNSLIVSADLDNFNFNLRINSITEDEKNYYATYTYQTLVVENSIWQNKEIEKVLTVNKEALDGKDLGLYVAKELGENVSYELSYLKRVKALEKEKGESQKIVTTEYSGLIGKLLDPKEQVIEGYSPVIPEVVLEELATVESDPASVILSTPYYEPSDKSASTPTEEHLQNAPQQESPTEPTSEEVVEEGVGDEVVPTPAEMVDEELIQEVVEELLPEPEVVSEPSVEVAPDSTPTNDSQPSPEAPPSSETTDEHSPASEAQPLQNATAGEAELTP
ncbi:MAG: hypothetical protein A3A96_00530 [Candidatus Zambryskibacteria bacterium RIFCSPLOWO2_01_FULL_39_39]|uniref:Uncharacterized protein n=1 Tax=Candidatus Zambryskibacteria bacterium RIFCSPLOWO2_01_FULL_39_39 TaxID=1802758 RepID=A0A1G2TZC8_9BACT|nr:MAG: hypothetical protein UT00_C0004G0001 [Parcubacteria group bacterium GW2011_GWA1_38_7]OHA87806.1 MAG: hypothetical protein A2644_01365 [Candidatus Zambryskibacteria bacterium RIFCSPHIGHO2_01_FULL_39_63]OHA94969.1 MAG: hypothetical protein A3B88_01150 [Candidatus Zambryskibacteria bacterium RIFCSPHIGHO2_02_FULL_39_19]OHA99150.1 MAG: hypothetical protein A3F20_03100 [Candidatus Zambryskibacteria bacterium RIFCSPHIGHO2_12_FULL_39_21]OHB01912.1 MAG: hypothetical protein A3A96_00530 [Candidat